MKRASPLTLLLFLATALGCGQAPLPTDAVPTAFAPKAAEVKTPRPPRPELTILAVGDINLGRSIGKRLLGGAVDYPFALVRDELSRADIAFANLESQLSDQKGQTEGSSNYVFTGPPQGADALARAGFDVVSTSNNHAWDFGERGMRETIANVRRVGILPVGTGPTLDDAYQPVVVERDGWKVGFIAVTGVFNSPFETSPARNYVAWADLARVAPAIARLREDGVDLVFVSYHGGVEYQPDPSEETRQFARGCLDAGADAFIGHHPHVTQGVEWHNGRPIFYSLGNFLFKQFDPWTNRGLGVRLTARDGAGLDVEYIPFHVDYQPRILSGVEGAPLLERIASLSGGRLVKNSSGDEQVTRP